MVAPYCAVSGRSGWTPPQYPARACQQYTKRTPYSPRISRISCLNPTNLRFGTTPVMRCVKVVQRAIASRSTPARTWCASAWRKNHHREPCVTTCGPFQYASSTQNPTAFAIRTSGAVTARTHDAKSETWGSGGGDGGGASWSASAASKRRLAMLSSGGGWIAKGASGSTDCHPSSRMTNCAGAPPARSEDSPACKPFASTSV
mmetsp:Transcript_20704/g.67051  ORF Transcript_20704/g.67051 Transcript_20704/m.67051 type:complete len:203 (-) Transcript_20704:611-1219(-)